MPDVILCNLSDANTIIAEERTNWINDVFDALNIPDEVFDVDDINHYRANMNELGIDIVLYANGEVDVFKKAWHEEGNNAGWLTPTKQHLVAQWKTPEKIMRVEGDGRLHYEIYLKSWIANMKGLIK